MDTLHNDFLMPLTEEKCILKRNCQSQNKHNKQINTCSWGISCSSPLRPPSPEARFVAFCSEKVFIFCILTKARFAQKKHYIFVADLLHELLNLTGVDCSKRTLQHGFNFIIPLDIRNKDKHGNPNQSTHTCYSFTLIS